MQQRNLGYGTLGLVISEGWLCLVCELVSVKLFAQNKQTHEFCNLGIMFQFQVHFTQVSELD